MGATFCKQGSQGEAFVDMILWCARSGCTVLSHTGRPPMAPGAATGGANPPRPYLRRARQPQTHMAAALAPAAASAAS
jgi:hypothetical protein